MMPFEPYGLSKQVGECIGQMVARSSATSAVSLRFTNVVPPERQAEFPLPAPTPENPTTLVMWAYAPTHAMWRRPTFWRLKQISKATRPSCSLSRPPDSESQLSSLSSEISGVGSRFVASLKEMPAS